MFKLQLIQTLSFSPSHSHTPSLVSRDGYVVVDDTNRPQLDDSPWPWVVNKTYPHPKPEDCSAVLATEVTSHRVSLCGIIVWCG